MVSKPKRLGRVRATGRIREKIKKIAAANGLPATRVLKICLASGLNILEAKTGTK